MSDLETLIEQVKSYDPHADVELIRKAYAFAEKAHEGQMRLSGDPYLSHPYEAARALADLEMDPTSIAAGLLHDVLEDAHVTVDQLKAQFGAEIALLVDGVTKLKLADFEIEPLDLEKGGEVPKKRHAEFKRSAENLRKIFLAMARDLRVMVIKLADRLHNMMTLSALPSDRQKKVASETLQIFAPLAHRLGIWKIKWQLEDLAFKHLDPEAYETVVEKVARTRSEREEDLKEAEETIKARLAEDGVDAHIQGRPKHLYSIYQKMLKEGVDFQDIYDLSALRIIVNTVADCYHVLGVVHDQWMPIPDRFTDHIAKPKSNMYQSLHTKVVGPRGEPLEIQIRTWAMHRMAEFGIAAHWQYKEGGAKPGDQFDRKLSWLRQQLFDWQVDTDDASEFLRSVINDLFTDQVFVFTPKGDVVDLPFGSTPVDFAFRIHSEMGGRCVGAKVNGKIVPLTYKFNNGDIVEIITRSNSQPSLDWLNFVKTSHARNKIKSHFRKLHYADSVTKGREMLDREIERMGHQAQVALKPEKLLKVAQGLNLQSEEDMMAAIGYGHVAAATVMNRLKAELPAQDVLSTAAVRTHGEAKLSISLDGADRMMIKRGRCCAPIPGDEVVGYITRGRGMMMHRQSCPNVAAYRANEPERLVEVQWSLSDGEHYPAEIRIEALDRVGLLNDISAVFSEAKININTAKIRSLPNKTAVFDLSVHVPDVNHLNALMTAIGRLNDVMRIERVGYNAAARRAK